MAGKRLVAAGARGHIVYSDDRGATWQQAKVPVSADLTALHFADARQGWAVGHEGVVLHTRDGGATWQVQLDGRRANALVLEHVRKLPADTDPAVLEALKAEAERAAAEGPSRPFLDVWFANAARRFRRRRLQPDLPHRRRRQDLGALGRAHAERALLPPVWHPRQQRRPVHGRRTGTGAALRSRVRPLQRAADAVRRQLLRPADQARPRARLRPARHRLSLARRRPELGSGGHRHHRLDHRRPGNAGRAPAAVFAWRAMC